MTRVAGSYRWKTTEVTDRLIKTSKMGTRTKPNQCGEIHLDSQLFPTSNLQSWLSPSGHFAFGFYPQGNGFAIGIWLIGRPNNTVVWTVNRDDPPVSSNATIHFSEKGELLLRTEKGYEKPIAGDLNVSDSASMLDSGNFVLYSTDCKIIWQSFDFPTDTILGGQSLTISHELVSSVSSSNHSSGRFFLAMQEDGNLVAYPRKSANLPSDAYWSSKTFVRLNLSLNHQGHLSMKSYKSGPDVLVLANSSYSCENRTTIFRATLDAGGIFTLYSHCFESKTSWSVHTEWSALNNQCDVHGFCDFNSYCSGTGTNGECSCYPGFVFNDPDDKFSGCYRNASEGFCAGRKEGRKYQVTGIENLSFEQDPYSAQELEKEKCRLSCQEDCHCGVALYIQAKCEKHTFPIRWAYQCFVAGQLDMLVKDEHVEYESLERMVRIGLCCVQNDPSLRPAIKNVILMLEGSEDIPNPPSVALEIISP
ncbi:S-RECEPTOR KINASE-LIKE PROTEIN [Salix viminalis]|uniref:S-RECEPTOR KINASE-LIKE PROTEIN n=1 Tax=Salix viminalis TaxID=40686 RepID=A0A9Q0NXQ3_SALVM|nr:S-RECEPTOR KINASE-LIKE PROTEIN [Salix viminalis]